MILFLRLIAGGLFAIGGWKMASGLRQNEDAALNWGIGLIVAGLLIETARIRWFDPSVPKTEDPIQDPPQ